MKHGGKLAVLVFLALFVFLWLIKPALLSAFLSHELHLPLAIRRASIWPSEMTLHNLQIKNPKGFSQESANALVVQTTKLRYDLPKLLEDPLVIEEMTMDQISLSIIFPTSANAKSNWNALSRQIPRNKGSRGVWIKRWVLTDLAIEVQGLDLSGASTREDFALLEFDNIRSANGFPIAEMIQRSFEKIGMQSFIEGAFAESVEPIEGLMEPL